MSARVWLCLVGVCLACVSQAAERELILDPHFQNGFYFLEAAPGKRVVYAEVNGFAAAKPVWDLAQWSSRFPLSPGNRFETGQTLGWSNVAKIVTVRKSGGASSDLSLGVNAGAEYEHPRTSASTPWVHLLVQQDLTNPPSLAELGSCRFHLEARLKRSVLADTNGYSPALHAAQYLVYLTIANVNPKSSGYHDCFWFGIPIYDNRSVMVPAYEARDFGQTKLFIFTPGSDNFSHQSTHDGQWVTFERDLLPLWREGLEHAWSKGFFKARPEPADFRPLGIFIGWEVPGMFDAELEIRGLSLRADVRR